MNLKSNLRKTYWPRFKEGLAVLVVLQMFAGASLPAFAQTAQSTEHTTRSAKAQPQSPIQHVIIIIGENRTFDHVFATYKPKGGQTVSNLLSRGIVNADGTPGPNFSISEQYTAKDTAAYSIAPLPKHIYKNITPAETQSAPTSASDTRPAPFQTLAVARLAEPDLLNNYYSALLTGATGLPHDVIDTRIANVHHLGKGVFQLTPSVKYDDYAGSPVHRFYQMWQQADCSITSSTSSNPSGCLEDLFPWVETTIGAGSNGQQQQKGFNPLTTGEGSTSMEFYNMQQGDAPYLRSLAEQYTLSDNYHQGVMGGTGANHIMIGYGDALWYSDGNGNALTPPSNQIENPDPQPGTNNWYTEDGYSGGSYSNCSDITQPGVPAVVNYLQALSTSIRPNCRADHYYLLNNYNPGYNGDGTLASQYSPYTILPVSVRHIGDVLSAAGLSYTYFGEHWDLYVTDPTESNPYDRYCNICNPFQYAIDIMTDPVQREAHIQDTNTLYEDIDTGNLGSGSIRTPRSVWHSACFRWAATSLPVPHITDNCSNAYQTVAWTRCESSPDSLPQPDIGDGLL